MFHHYMDVLLGIDFRLLTALHTYAHYRFLDVVMPWVTYLGDGLVLFVLSGITYLLGNRHDKKAAIDAVKVLILVGLVVQVLKHLVGRPRPFGGSPDSFPSGHTAVIFGLAQVYGTRYRRFKLLFLALAVLVGLSRLYVGAHYPLDVLAGMAIGVVVAAALMRNSLG
ncbi:MAG TPA: phosphatase PAP2 family protein [Firmicutes bacterium]|nr:phosphatase PAP2 family protein [Bacillota bacterium]